MSHMTRQTFDKNVKAGNIQVLEGNPTMKTPTIYERNAYLYGYAEQTGQLMRLEYLPTPKSRKWRPSSITRIMCENADKDGQKIMTANGWDAIRWVKG